MLAALWRHSVDEELQVFGLETAPLRQHGRQKESIKRNRVRSESKRRNDTDGNKCPADSSYRAAAATRFPKCKAW